MAQKRFTIIPFLFKETKTRILISYLTLMMGFAVLAIPIAYHVALLGVKQRVTEDLWENFEAFETFVNEQESTSNQSLNQENLRDLFKNFLSYHTPEDDNFFITIVGKDFYASSPQALPRIINENSDLMQHLQQVKQHSQGEQKTNNPALGTVIYIAKPIKKEGQILGVLAIAHTTAGEIKEAIDAILAVISVFLIALVITFFLAWIVSGEILSPLRSLTVTARKISESDLSQRIAVQGTGELAELGNTFNEMMERLEQSFITQRKLLNDVGHELRTPITIIQGHLELMGDEPQEQQETLTLVFDELERMTRMVNDLILLAKMSRPDFLQVEVTDLYLFSQELFKKMTTLASRNWHLVSLSSRIIQIDSQRLTQAIMNLVENAIQHTTETDQIEFGSEIEQNKLRFWVKDTGVGIALSEQEHIFERFVQGEKRKSMNQGSGLGLSIVQAIAEAHGGWVELVSAQRFGSTFSLILPLNKVIVQKIAIRN